MAPNYTCCHANVPNPHGIWFAEYPCNLNWTVSSGSIADEKIAFVVGRRVLRQQDGVLAYFIESSPSPPYRFVKTGHPLET
jgi:hypothetical protein